MFLIKSSYPRRTDKISHQPPLYNLKYYRYRFAHRTHAIVHPVRSLYNHAWNRVRDYSGLGGESSLGFGVGMSEARHWHRRAYGGLVSSHFLCARLYLADFFYVQGSTTQMLPAEIGHAAAYEAYRTWIHNSSIYEPLSGDIERQREGLIGLAIAEGELTLVYLISSLTNLTL